MKLFVFDVDGTLVGLDYKLKKRTINALNLILENGDAIAIASGRPFLGIKQYLDKLVDGKKFAIAANGAATYDEEKNIIDFCGLHFKDLEDFYQKYKWLIKERNASIYGYSHEKVIYHELSKMAISEGTCNRTKIQKIRNNKFKDDDPLLKFMIVIDSKDISDIDFKEEKKLYNVVDSSPIYHEFVNKDTDKSRGVEAVRKYLKLEKKDCYCFGDEMNDYRMIKDFHGIAMGNAVEKVKEVAKETILSVNEFGVADFLERFYKK